MNVDSKHFLIGQWRNETHLFFHFENSQSNSEYRAFSRNRLLQINVSIEENVIIADISIKPHNKEFGLVFPQVYIVTETGKKDDVS